MPNLSPKFAVKPGAFLNTLIINILQNVAIFHEFVKIFHKKKGEKRHEKRVKKDPEMGLKKGLKKGK